MDNLLPNLETRVHEVKALLKEHAEWEAKFQEHAEIIDAKKRAKPSKVKKMFRIRTSTGLAIYSGISSIKTSSNKTLRGYLRYAGQNVAQLKLQTEKDKDGKYYQYAYLKTKGDNDHKDYGKHNKEYFNITATIPNWSEWKSKEAQDFRHQFNHCTILQGISPEHAVECALLREFSKKTRANKKLPNIQPVKMGGYFFQMTTPFGASTENLNYEQNRHKGGGIDIMARVRMKTNEIRLVIFELKDENKAGESPSRVIKQAVTYAAFIGELLYSNSGDLWWKIFGFGSRKPEHITIIASTLMPLSDNPELNHFGCEGEKIEVSPNVDIELHSLFYDKETGNFVGSLRDIMRE